MLFYNPGFGKVLRLGYVKVKRQFRPIAKMCKFKRLGGGPFLSFREGPEPPRHGPALITVLRRLGYYYDIVIPVISLPQKKA